jgi:dihydrofolate reductase/thymidylate synthase
MKYIIVAIDSNSGIGKNNSLPWDLKKDLRHFSEITKGNVVIMGKHTWLSIPEKHKPLKDRINIVISSSLEIKNTDVKVFKSINDALEYAYTINCNDVYFIGGNKIYKEVIDKNLYDGIYLTQIYKKFECDTFFPNFCKNNIISESEIYEENNISFQFKYYKNNFSFNSEESQYTNIIKEILNNGNEKSDRTGTGTKSLFGKTMRFDLSNGKIPLLTTKRVFWRGVAEELLWFISGNTNAKILQDKNIHIWDGNGSKEYLSSIGLGHREEGDLGEVYGFQWRHYGAEYKTMNDNYDGQGIDQLLNLIETIKTNPNDRRMIITAWNPSALKNMSLPPCFTCNTPVKTKNGYKMISDVNDDDCLYTHKNNIQKINKRHITSYSGEMLTLKIKSIPKIETTPGHPFFVREINYKKHPRLHVTKIGNPSWVNAKDLTINHFHGIKLNENSIIPEFKIIKGKNKNATEEIIKKLDKKEEWYFLGYYLGDGWCRWDRKSTFYLVFNNNHEEELKHKFSKVCKTSRIKQKQKGCVVYEYYSYELYYILQKFGRKAHSKIIPDWVQNAPVQFLNEFIKGYIKADGYYKTEKLACITTTSTDIALNIQTIAFKCGLKNTNVLYQKRPKKCIIEGREVNQRDTYSISINFKENISDRTLILDGYIWFQYKYKKTYDVQNINVYNFDVGEDHTYIVNNVCVHNCHLLSQFYVNDNKLSCQMYQRSADMGLGVPFNIASYSLLTCLIAHCTDLEPGEFIHIIGDAHIYKNHIDPLKKQLKREPREFPTIKINTENKDITKFLYEDLVIENYKPYKSIKMKMSV